MNEKCQICEHSGADCLPYLLSISSLELLDWCRERKDALGLSNLELAQKANVPKGTIDRLLSSGNAEYRYSTIQPVLIALVGCAGNMDCNQQGGNQSEAIKHKEEMIGHLNAEVEHLKHYNDEAEKTNHANIEYLTEQVKYQRKIITLIGTLLLLALLLIIVALIVDRINLDVGFFWLHE